MYPIEVVVIMKDGLKISFDGIRLFDDIPDYEIPGLSASEHYLSCIKNLIQYLNAPLKPVSNPGGGYL